jgi:hypothetical protein
MAETMPEVMFVQAWFDPLLILGEQPDAVVEVRVERVLATLPFMPAHGGQLDEWSDTSASEGRLLLSLDASSPARDLSTEGPARVEPREDVLEFASELNLAGWILPRFVREEGERAWLHVELESDTRGLLAVYRRSNETGKWLRRDTAWLRYGAGRQSRTIALPGPAGPREIRLHHFRAPASVRIRLIEVRATRP